MKKKYILGMIFGAVLIVLITVFAISASAENTITVNDKEIEDEKTLVKTVSSLSRGVSANDVVDKETLETQLNRYAGSGVTSVTEKSSDILVVTFLASGREYEINVNTGSTSLPNTQYTTPYLPTGFIQVANTDLETGLTIQDNLGNQYVWIEVPKTSTVYPTAGLNITAFSGDEYTKIENDLHTYTSVYRNGTTCADEYYSEEVTGLAEVEYNTLKKNMLKSVYQNGGFYIGKYETGIAYSEGARTASGTSTQTPVIQANSYPYNWVTCTQAQSLANSMLSGEYTSSLMFGVQWDLVLKYLETKGVTQSELNSDSKEWGNCNNSLWNITNTNAKYMHSGNGWLSAPYEKTSTGIVLLSTGANDRFCKQGIYDLAGNVNEYTLEKPYNTERTCVQRGGSVNHSGTEMPVRRRVIWGEWDCAVSDLGFRVTLY